MASVEDFREIDLRVGRIVAPFPEARKPAYRLEIDFGPLRRRASSAQLSRRYRPEDPARRHCVAVVNLPPRQVGPVRSEVLVLGAVPDATDVILLRPDAEIAPGTPIA